MGEAGWTWGVWSISVWGVSWEKVRGEGKEGDEGVIERTGRGEGNGIRKDVLAGGERLPKKRIMGWRCCARTRVKFIFAVVVGSVQ